MAPTPSTKMGYNFTMLSDFCPHIITPTTSTLVATGAPTPVEISTTAPAIRACPAFSNPRLVAVS